MPTAKDDDQNKSQTGADDFVTLAPPEIPALPDHVVLVFANNIPEDSRKRTKLTTGAEYPLNKGEAASRQHLLRFVRERLQLIAHLEYSLWLNGQLPFITPRELLIWRLRRYVEHIWAFQLPDDDDLAMVFNTTRQRAANLASDFSARYRKSLLFPMALRRLYRMLRNEDSRFVLVDKEVEVKKALGSTFKVPSIRYLQDANALVDEFRLRDNRYLRNAAMFSKEDKLLWVSEEVLAYVHDDKLKTEILNLYQLPSEGSDEG